MHARCWSLHTLQLDCCACAASLVPSKLASTSSVIAKILMTRVLSVLKRQSLALRARRLVERGAQSPGKLQGVVIGPEMKKEQPWLLIQHVAVDRGYVDAIRPQRFDHGIYFVPGKHKIAGNGRLAAAGRLETDRVSHAQRSYRGNLHSAFHDRIAARHAKLIDAAVRLTFDADDLIKLRRVEIDRRWSGCGWRR